MSGRPESFPAFDDLVLTACRAGRLAPDVVCVVDEGMCVDCSGVIQARVL